MPASTPDPRIAALCAQITAKRPRAVIDHILKHGFVTTEDLQDMGYDHPPRAARDVRENGVPLETFKVQSGRTGRQIAAYRFGDPAAIKSGRIGGRKAFSKAFKVALLDRYGSVDAITGDRLDSLYLQIDHRIPYEVAGDGAALDQDPAAYMLLDASNQRGKSWSCEHCRNWNDLLDPAICKRCFWAFPESYDHVAMVPERRLTLTWRDTEAAKFDDLKRRAAEDGITPADYIKGVIERSAER